MNTMKSSSIFKLSSYSYSNAYELEYSCLHVIIMIYELAYRVFEGQATGGDNPIRPL
jgi:hypothetical protein